MNIMLEQWIDYHLFHGYEHFYFYDHLFNRDKNDINIFWNVLLQYLNKNIITYIQWPMSQKQKERRYFQVNAFLHSMRWFQYQTNYLSLTDIDEWIIIYPKNQNIENNKKHSSNKHINNLPLMIPNLKSVYQQSIEISKSQKKSQFTYHILYDYPSMPDVYNMWYFPNKVKISENKQLGCDINNIYNKYNTYLERQSCLHYKIQDTNISKLININHKSKKSSKFISEKEITKYMSYIGNNAHNTVLKLHGKSKQPPAYYAKRARSQIDYFAGDKWAGGYELKPKVILNPKIGYIGYQHAIYYFTPGYKKISLNNDKYEIFLIHLIDHWRNSEKRTNIINWKSEIEVNMFFNMTYSQCDYENVILWWNQQFLKSKYGIKHANKSLINPLLDSDGLFCYFKKAGYKNVWIAGNRRRRLKK